MASLPTSSFPRVDRAYWWLAVAAALNLLAVAAWLGLDLPVAGGLLLAGAFGSASLALATLGGVLPLWVRRVERVRPALVLAVPVVASVLVANAASRRPEFDHYWGWFALWLGAMATTVGVSAFAPTGRLALSRQRLSEVVVWTMRRPPTDLLLVVALTAAAAAVRLPDLGGIPWPFSGDEAAHLFRARAVLDGDTRNMFESGLQGQPNSYYFALAGTSWIFGDSVAGARMFGALLGIALVPVLYLFLRRAFGRDVALVGGVYLVAYHFAVHFSRQDLNNIGEPVVLGLVVLFLYLAVTRQRPLDFALTGIWTGLALYVAVGARVALPLVPAVLLFAIATQPRRWRPVVLNLPYLVAGFVVAAAPLGWFWIQHPEEFNNRIDTVGIFQSGWLESESELTGRSELSLLWEQVRRSVGAFGFYTDVSNHYRAEIPCVDRLSIPVFVTGMGVAFAGIRRPQNAMLLALFFGTVVAGGVLTIEPPTSNRLLPTVPPAVAFIALGILFWARLAGRLRSWAAPMLAGAVVLALVSYNLHYYFADYAGTTRFSDLNTRIATVAGQYISSLPEGVPAFWFGAPHLPASHPSFRYWTEGARVHEVLEDGSVQPPPDIGEQPAAYLALPGEARRLEGVKATCPGGREETVADDHGEALFLVYEAAEGAHCLAAPPAEARGR